MVQFAGRRAPGLDSGRKALADAIRAAIRDGCRQPDAVVPSTRALATDPGVARATVTRVYADLAAEGYLRTSQGRADRGRDGRGRAVASAGVPAHVSASVGRLPGPARMVIVSGVSHAKTVLPRVRRPRHARDGAPTRASFTGALTALRATPADVGV